MSWCYIFPVPKINRAPRIKHASLSHMTLELESLRLFKFMNISHTGIGFSIEEGSPLPSKGQILAAKVKLGADAFDLKIEVVNVQRLYIGARFVEAPLLFKMKLSKAFSTEMAAAELQKVDSQWLKKKADEIPFWFTNGKKSELYYTVQGSTLESFRVSMSGHFLEYLGQALRSGSLQHKVEDKPSMPGEGSEVFDGEISPSLREQAIKFVEHIEEAEPLHLRQIIEILQK